MLQVQAGEQVWPVLSQLYLHSSPLLRQVSMLLLELQPVTQQHLHEAYSVHQHLYQELGFQGYYHSGDGMRHALSQQGGGSRGGAAAAGSAQAASGSWRVGLVNMRLQP